MSKFLLPLLLFTELLFAQTKSVTHQNLYWLRYYNQLTISKKLVWHNEFENRRFFENNRQHHFIAHTRLHYKVLPKTELAAGLTYSLQSPQDPNASSSLVVPEIRGVQELSWSQGLTKRFTLQHRFRIDERFIRRNNGTMLFEGSDFNFRFRYRLQGNLLLTKPENPKPLTLKISDELMINAGKNIVYNQFDQNRLALGFEKVFDKHFSAPN